MGKVFNLWIVRHGETNENKQGILQGHQDTILNERGMHQSYLVGKRLASHNFTHIFSSDLKRSLKTCEVIVENNKHKSTHTIKQDKRLRERNFGILEGCSKAEIEIQGFMSRLHKPQGGENALELQERAKSFWMFLCHKIVTDATPVNPSITHAELSEHPVSDEVLLVTHGGFIRELSRYLLENCNCLFPCGKESRTLPDYSPFNCSITHFKVAVDGCNDSPTVVCSVWGDKSHIM